MLVVAILILVIVIKQARTVKHTVGSLSSALSFPSNRSVALLYEIHLFSHAVDQNVHSMATVNIEH